MFESVNTFLAFIKSLHTELRLLNNNLQKHSEAIDKATNATKEYENKAPEVRAILNYPESILASKEAANAREQKYQNRNFLLGLATLISLVIYAITTIFIYCATNKAANAAKSAADTARDTLIYSERPWVIITVTLEEPPHSHSFGPGLFFNNDGSATLNAFVVVKNIGHSVAKSIYVHPKMYPPVFENLLTEPADKQKSWCDKDRSATPDIMRLPSLFPGEETTLNFTFGMSKEEIKAALQSEAFGKRYIVPAIYGCANYTFGFSNEVHQTPFLYQLNPVPIAPGIIPASKLELIKRFEGRAPD